MLSVKVALAIDSPRNSRMEGSAGHIDFCSDAGVRTERTVFCTNSSTSCAVFVFLPRPSQLKYLYKSAFFVLSNPGVLRLMISLKPAL